MTCHYWLVITLSTTYFLTMFLYPVMSLHTATGMYICKGEGVGAYIKESVQFKGQMNQKIEIFSFVALPSPNTKKKHPKWDLGKDFSSQAFIER